MPQHTKSGKALLVMMITLIVFSLLAAFWLRYHKTAPTPSMKGTPTSPGGMSHRDFRPNISQPQVMLCNLRAASEIKTYAHTQCVEWGATFDASEKSGEQLTAES